MNLINKSALLYIRDGKILSTRSKGKDVYYLPGGKPEAGESDVEALHREIFEELGVHLFPQTIQNYGIFEALAHGKAESVIVRMTCFFAEIEGEPSPRSEIEEVVWLGYGEKVKCSLVDQLIFDDLFTKGLLSE